jgi:hypothetical protein
MIDTTDVHPILMAQCLAWHRRWTKGAIGAFPKAAHKEIESLISLRAKYARRHSEQSAKLAATSAPGYVIIEVAGQQLHVPFHLVDAVPLDDTLNVLLKLADHVRLSQISQICISGSAVFLGRLDDAADIDFCEYVTVHPIAIQEQLKYRCSAVDPALFVKGRVDSTRLTRREAGAYLDGAGQIAPQVIKLDYVSLVEPFLVPLSNISLFVDPARPEVAVANRSWPFQEIAIGGDAPIFQIMRPELLGQYMDWLLDRIDEYLASNPVKALKRALSLSRVLGTGHSQLYPLLTVTELAQMQKRTSVEEALKMAKAVEHDGGHSAVAALSSVLETLPLAIDQTMLTGQLQQCRTAVEAFRTDVEELASLADLTLVGGP